MALGLCQNFIPIKYLENKLMDFDEIICMKFCWSFQQSYGPWLMLKFKFFSISLEIMNRFWLNFVYALIYMIHVVTNIHYFPEHFNRVMTLDWFYAQYLVKKVADLMKSGRYIDTFVCQNMRNYKNKHSGGVSCACNAIVYSFKKECLMKHKYCLWRCWNAIIYIIQKSK